MKKKSIIYISAMLFSFIFSLNQVNARDMTFSNNASNFFTSDYSECTIDANQSDYVGIANINNGIMFYIKGKPGSYLLSWAYKNRANITGTCIRKSDGKKEDMKFIVMESAGIYDGSDLNKSNSSSDGSSSSSNNSGNSSNTGIPTEIEIKDGKSNEFIPGYSDCEFIKATSIPSISFKNTKAGNADGVGIYVINVSHPNKPYAYQTEKLACINNTTKSKDEFTVRVYGSAKVMENSSVVGTDEDDSKSEDNSYEVGTNCDSILGSIDEDGSTSQNGYPSVAYVLQKVLNIMKFLGPILAICMTILDSIKTVTSGDKDALSKLLKTSSKRLIYAVLLFVFPVILDFVLNLVSAHGTCGIQ